MPLVMDIARLNALNMESRMDVEPEERIPYPDPDQREPSYPDSDQHNPYPDPERSETPRGVFRPLSQNPESIRVRTRKQALVGPARELENARGNMATTVSRRRTQIKATQQYQEASEDHKTVLLQETRTAVEAEFRQKGRHPEQVAARLGLPMPPKVGLGRPCLNDPRGRPRIHRENGQQSNDVMDISQQLNHEADEEDGADETAHPLTVPARKTSRVDRLSDVEIKLMYAEGRIRVLEQQLENERAKTAKFETRLARIEVVFNPRLLRTNEATLASLEQRNVMANGAALNPAP